MVQQEKDSGTVRARQLRRSPTPESLQYGGDGSYGGHCCCHDPSGSPSLHQHPHQQHPTNSGCCSNNSQNNLPANSDCSNLTCTVGQSCSGCPLNPHHGDSNASLGPTSAGSSSTGGPVASSAPSAVKFELGRIEVCEGCGLAIADRYVMRVADGSWHEDCLVCCVCHAPLAHSCFTRSGRIYCRQDYDRVFGVKCGRCAERLYPHELVMRAGSLVFHLPCFGCFICGRPLQKGDQFVVRGGQLLCRADLEKDLYLIQSANNGDDLTGDENNRPRDGRRGPKRPRTILTSAQRRQFKASFEISPKPCRKVREALAKETGLSVRVVQVWFQNQRAKMKKLQRKAKIEAEKNASSSMSSGDKNGKDGDSGRSSSKGDHKKRFTDHGETSHGGNGSSSLMSSMPYSPNGDGSYAGHSGDSLCGSDLSLDDSGGFDQLDDGHSLSGVDIQDINHHHHAHSALGNLHGSSLTLDASASPHHVASLNSHHSHAAAEQLLTAPSSYHPINPIDKLYLMQNAYFRLDQ